MNPAVSNRLPPATGSIAYPLEEFYARAAVPLPPLEQIDGEEMPEPYKTLLVHETDMTSALENFHQGTIHLRVLGRERRGHEYFREVVLGLEGSEKPVEFGAIKINLDRFKARARQQILEEHWPLGRILKDCALVYASRPKAFLRIASDKLINSVLNLNGAHLLYGRRNTLIDAARRPLAEIVEILPPASPSLKRTEPSQ
jgi:chorismate-pyruvate lyase